MIPFITSRTSTWRLLPPRLAGGIKGSTCAHSSSVRSLGYRNLLRSQRPRFFSVHIGGAPLESGHHFESQTIQRIQNVFGRTLRDFSILDCRLAAILIATPAACSQCSTKRHKRQSDWPLDAVLLPRSHHIFLRRKLSAPLVFN